MINPEIKVGSVVVLNKLKDAVQYKVIERDRINVKIQEGDYSPYWVDASLCQLVKGERNDG